MKFIKRPIQNIKSIKWGMIVWVGFWTALLFTVIIPAETQMRFINSFKFLFSTYLYETEKTFTFPDATETIIALDQNLNNVYKLLNIGKIALWAMVIVMTFSFLFKSPKLSDE